MASFVKRVQEYRKILKKVRASQHRAETPLTLKASKSKHHHLQNRSSNVSTLKFNSNLMQEMMGPFFLLKVCLIFTHMPNKVSLILLSPLISIHALMPPHPSFSFLSLIQTCSCATCLSPCGGLISVDKALQSPHVLSCLIGPRRLIQHLITRLVSMLLNFQGRVLPLDNLAPSQGYVLAHISLNHMNNCLF